VTGKSQNDPNRTLVNRPGVGLDASSSGPNWVS
jgi:hypothetical protein